MNQTRHNRLPSLIVAGLMTAAVMGCSSPESKVAAYIEKGQAYASKGELAKARIEFQNALQINPNASRAMVGLADLASRTQEWERAFILLGKIVELEPKDLESQVKFGKLQLAAGQLDKALETSNSTLALGPDKPEVLALRAAVLFKLNDSGAAVELAKRVVAQSPNHPEALVVLASERLKAGDPGAALAYLDKGIEGNEQNVSMLLIKVKVLEGEAKVEAAEATLRKLVAMDPNQPGYRQMLAKFYLSHRLPDKAEGEYRELVRLRPTDEAAREVLLGFLVGAKGPAAAAAQLETWISAQPKNLDLKLNLASIRADQNQSAAARALWKSVIDEAGDAAAGLRARGALAANLLKNSEKALANPLITDILAKDARNETALLLRAGIGIEERRLDDAIADLRTVLRDAPESARAHMLLGRAHELQGQQELAQSEYARGSQLTKFAPAFSLQYAEFLLKLNRPKLAEGVLREVLRAHPKHVPALRLLAQAELSAGDLAAAQAVSDEIAEADQAVDANQIRGAILFKRKDATGSVASFRKAQELAPGETQPMVSLVRSYLAAGRTNDAIAFMKSVVAASPSNTGAQVILGQTLAQAGNWDGARKAFRLALAKEPKNLGATLGLYGVEMQDRRFDEAGVVLDKALQIAPTDFKLRLARAGHLELTRDVDGAIALYEKLLAEKPNADVVANNLASLLAERTADPAATKRAYELAQRFKRSTIPHYKDTLGWTTHLAGKHREAVDLIRAAATQLPSDPTVLYHEGMVHIALSNVDEARRSLRRSVELGRTSPFRQLQDAQQALQKL